MSLVAIIHDSDRFAPPASGVDRHGGLAGARRYVVDRLLPRFSAGDFELRSATGGGKSLVYLLTIAGQEPLILRADRKVRLLRKRMRHHDLLASLGFSCPTNVLLDASRATRRRFGQAFLVERRVAGVNFEDGDTRAAAAPIGAAFARLHRFVGRTAGAPGVWRRPADVGRGLQRTAQQLLHRHKRLGLPESSKIESWFADLPPAAWRHRPRLCHQDVSANNVLIESLAGGSRIGLVDLAELSYSSAAYELGRLRVKLFPSDDFGWRLCREAYLDSAANSLREEIDRTWRVGMVLACLHYAVNTPFAAARRERLADVFAIIGR